MAPATASARHGAPRAGWIVLLAMLLALSALHLLPPGAFRPLDRTAPDGLNPPAAAPLPTADESFPGAAYFFAEDAFAPVGGGADATGPVAVVSPGSGNPHIWQIEATPAALSMPLRAATPLDGLRALQCMTNAIYYEAGNEPEEGQRAVAQVILNRLASPLWPDSVCGVIYQGGERSDMGCQFTFSCDGSMARLPASQSWARARDIARRALSGEIFAPVGLSTYYHTLAVHPPWADRMRPVAIVGAHIFYRMPGAAGSPGAFRLRYSGRESAAPGPYAFSRPQKLPPLPAGPLPEWGSAPLPAATPAPPMAAPRPGTELRYSGLPLSATYPAQPGGEEGGLPDSTIRPEYRNSGRPLPGR